jgi:hypothetical protein
MSRKYAAFKAAQSRQEARMPTATPIDEAAIAAALAAAAAPRYEGDAAQLCAIATHAGMDQAMLTWWIRKPATDSRDWGALALRNWTARYKDLLQHITTAGNVQPAEPPPETKRPPFE